MEKSRKEKNAARVRHWLIALREEKGMTQGQVANAAGLAQPSYFEFEKGISTPRPETAMKIAAVLGFPWTRFFEEKSDNVDGFEVGADE